MLDKIKNLKGIFYKKIKMAKETEVKHETIPGFSIRKTTRFIDFQKPDDPTKINILYPLIEPFAYVNIKWNPETKVLDYIVIEPELEQKEKETLKKISEGLIELVEVELSSIKETSKAIEYIETNVKKVIKELGLVIPKISYIKILYYIYRNFVGLNEIEPLMQDPNIEDISCDGVGTPLYVIHRKYGSLKTNVSFEELEDLREFVVKLAERTGRYVSYAEPILAGTLPDGSRVSATLAGDVATRGPTFTIRKFSEKPISPIEQIDLGTANADVLSYFWYLIENGASVLIVGGTATGKTSFLNSLAMFIPPEAKIVSIEDTREIRIPHEHWIPGLARVGFGIPMPTGEKYGTVDLFDLLKESFRQNPDYVIVGETRGPEASVMFQGMASGHPSMSTFHAGSVDTLIKRLTTPPIDLSPTLIESLDIIAVMVHAREKGKSARRIKEVIEVESIDPKTGEVKTKTIFRWNPVSDDFDRVEESAKLKEIVETRGGSLEQALKEIETRKQILLWLRQSGKKDFLEVSKIFNQYYKEPEKILKEIGVVPIKVIKPAQFTARPVMKMQVEKKIEPAKQSVVRKGRLKERSSILDLLGFKILREKT